MMIELSCQTTSSRTGNNEEFNYGDAQSYTLIAWLYGGSVWDAIHLGDGIMISWVYRSGNVTHLVGYDKSMNKIADLVEEANEWVLTLHGQVFRVNGNGCADPISYVERIISPPVQRKLYHPRRQFLQYESPSGRSWEVWSQ